MYGIFGAVGCGFAASLDGAVILRKEKGDGLSRSLISRMAQVGAGGSYPVAAPGVRLADGAAALHTDRGHLLPSLKDKGMVRLSPSENASLPVFLVGAAHTYFKSHIRQRKKW